MQAPGKTLQLLAAMAMLTVQGCDAPVPTTPSASGEHAKDILVGRAVKLQFDPANFVSVVNNRYNPLVPGTTFHYRTETPDGVETDEFQVTRNTKRILNVNATVVHDQVFLNGELTEDTFDWFAQDRQGNVWYLGEDSKTLEHGQVVSTEGSWEAGVNGAAAGIVMLANPKSGLAYQQEFAAGVAEDNARVLGLKASVTVPYGKFDGCLETLEKTPLDRGATEHKFYCSGVGLVLTVEPKGGPLRDELVSITHF
jgi:hypothetical protein